MEDIIREELEPKAEVVGDNLSVEVTATSHHEPMDGVDKEENGSPTEESLSAGKKPREPKHTEPGMAWIKPEYIDIHHKPKLDEEYLARSVAEQLQKNSTSETQDAGVTDREGEPPQKKMKVKGRNKRRPIEKSAPPSETVCRAVIRGEICAWGDKCKYCHDVGKFMESKPADLGEKCYTFSKYGKCPYGIICRYGSQHISKTFTNIIDELKWIESQKSPEVKNTLPKPVKLQLWKKKYDFSRADKAFEASKPGHQHGSEKACNLKTLPATKAHVEDSSQILGLTVAQSNSSQEQRAQTSSNGDGSDLCEPSITSKDSSKQGDSCDNIENQVLLDSESTALPDKGIITCESKETATGTPTEIKVKGPCLGSISDADVIRLRPQEKKIINFSDKLYLAPLTTVGNLPFRRVCKQFGVDVTCGEMALSTKLLKGNMSEWALVKRHKSEDLFGVQLCGSYPDSMTRCAQLLTDVVEVDFIDMNCGCPIDMVFKRGEGSAMMGRTQRLEQVVRGMKGVMGNTPLTVKMRTGVFEDKNIAHTLAPQLRDWGVDMVTIHGRSREQRYTRNADWDYVSQCAASASPMPIFGNGDIMSFEDARLHREKTGVAGLMVARGALIKPWVFTEIKEERNWDISAGERLDMLKDFVNYGLEHWGSDTQGVATTRRFLLEWLSFLHRYIPVGILERVPQKINEKPPYYFGRNDLETLMASGYCGDWVKISEMLLGPVPDGFTFLPKHKANAYK